MGAGGLTVLLLGAALVMGAVAALLTYLYRKPDFSPLDPRFSLLSLLLTPSVYARGRAGRIAEMLAWSAYVLGLGTLFITIILKLAY